MIFPTIWQLEMQAAEGWNALFWCNHDQPRAVSRFGDDSLNAGFSLGIPWITPPDNYHTINAEAL